MNKSSQFQLLWKENSGTYLFNLSKTVQKHYLEVELRIGFPVPEDTAVAAGVSLKL